LSARTIFFSLYGVTLDVVIAATFLWLMPEKRAIAAILLLAFSTFYCVMGRKVARQTNTSLSEGLIAVPLMLFGVVVMILVFATILVWGAALLPVSAVSWAWHNRRLLNQLNVAGRLMDFGQLEQRLIAGGGTVIEEWGLHGPLRIWWTGDDLLAKGLPPASDETFFAIADGAGSDWHSSSVRQYLDPVSGRASLVKLGHRRAGRIGKMFPQARTVLMAPTLIDVSAEN
jgi:hypothetical protein